MQLSREYLHSLFNYSDGKLYRKDGSLVGSSHCKGYLHTKINRKMYLLHRLIFMMHHGYLPKIVDHIDGDKANNHIENLRAASKAQNCQNAKLYKTSSTGVKGVRWSDIHKKYMIRVQVNNKRHTWYAKDLELAELVAIEARDKYHKQFANNGAE